VSGDGIDAHTLRLSEAQKGAADAAREVNRRKLATLLCRRYGVDPERDDNHWHRLSHTADAFAELAAALGLNPPPTGGPGSCRGCGGPMPLSRQTNHNGHTEKRVCRDCERKDASVHQGQ